MSSIDEEEETQDTITYQQLGRPTKGDGHSVTRSHLRGKIERNSSAFCDEPHSVLGLKQPFRVD